MQTLTALKEPPIALAEELPGGDAEPAALNERYPEIIAAFAEVSERIGGLDDLDAILRQVAGKACDLVGVTRCSVYLKDEETGLFRGQVGASGRDDAAIKRLTAGGPSDRFTQQILRERKPVLLRNAQTDLRPVRATMRRWGVETMLGVPMLLKHETIGLLFLDEPDRAHHFTQADEATAAAFANLAATSISQVRLTERLRSSLRTANGKNEIMRRAQELDDELAERMAAGANLHEIVSSVADLTGKACAVHGADLEQVAVSPAPAGDANIVPHLFDAAHRDQPEVRDALARAQEKGAVLVGPLASTGLPHRFMIVPVSAAGPEGGYLVLMEYPARFSALDLAMTRRAATMVTLAVRSNARGAEADAHARIALARDLLLGTDCAESLERRGAQVGIALQRPHLAVLFRRASSAEPPRPESVADVASLVSSADSRLSRAWAAQVPDGLAAIIPIGEDEGAVREATKAIHAAAPRIARGISNGPTIVAISSPITGAGAFSAAYRELLEVAKCAEMVAPAGEDIRVLSAEDLGPLRIFISTAAPEDLKRFAVEVLGTLADPQDEAHWDLLETLDAFFGAGQRVRSAAARLGVHQNTIRYRLGKIGQITGLDLTDEPHDRLSCQMALEVLRLTGVAAYRSRSGDGPSVQEGP